MYPNPVNDQVFISNPTGIKIEHITMYDVAGRIVSGARQSQTGTEISIDILKVAGGVYIVRIESALGIVNKLLVKRN